MDNDYEIAAMEHSLREARERCNELAEELAQAYAKAEFWEGMYRASERERRQACEEARQQRERADKAEEWREHWKDRHRARVRELSALRAQLEQQATQVEARDAALREADRWLNGYQNKEEWVNGEDCLSTLMLLVKVVLTAPAPAAEAQGLPEDHCWQLGDILLSYMDRLNDPCTDDPLDEVVKELLAKADPVVDRILRRHDRE